MADGYVSRKLGWIHDKEEIAREFAPEMAEGAARYWDAFKGLSLDAGARMLLPEAEPAPAAPQEAAEPSLIEGTLF